MSLNIYNRKRFQQTTQPRPQGFSLKKCPAPPIFWGKSPGDEVANDYVEKRHVKGQL